MASVHAPTWSIEVNGKPLPDAVRGLVTSIEVEATVDGADELRIHAQGWDSVARTWAVAGQDVLAPGGIVVVKMGWSEAEVVALQRFRLIRETTHYSENGVVVEVAGYSAEVRLVEYTQARKWPAPVTDSEVVREIAEEHGLVVTADSLEATQPRSDRDVLVKAQGTTDWELIRTLAGRNGYGPPFVRYDPDLDADVLWFRTTALDKQQDVATFVYLAPQSTAPEAVGGTLLSFDPEVNLAGMPTHVLVVGWDPWQQIPIAVLVTPGAGDQQVVEWKGKLPKDIVPPKSGSQLQVVTLKLSEGQKEKVEALDVATVSTGEDLVLFAQRWIASRNAAFTRARGRVIGWEGLWIGQAHRIDGVAPAHVGLWEVLGCTHIMDGSGYHCDLDVVRVLEEAAPAEEA